MTTQSSLFSTPGVTWSPPFLVVADSGGNDDTPPPPTAVQPVDSGCDLARRTVCLKLRLSSMGNTRKVSSAQIEADADKALLRVSKLLIESAELKAINRWDNEVRRYLYGVCLPFEIGIHLLPVAALETVEAKLREFAEARGQLVDAFLAAYPDLCQQAAERLRGLYNPADYPPVAEARRQFGFAWQYVSFGVPDQLKGISEAVWQQEREKAAQRMAEATSEIQAVLRESMARLVEHLAERLREGADGKPVRFKESTVSNLVEFLHNFEFRNVTDDGQLQTLVEQARGLLQGVDADSLRTVGDVRARVQAGMQELAVRLDALMEKSAGRKFRFEEEEECSQS